MNIKKIEAYQVFDSRGYPTIETEVILDNGVKSHAIVPSGASTGCYEALELRDEDPELFSGKSVFRAIENVNNIISPALSGLDVRQQEQLDRQMIELDGTGNKSRLGANAVLGVSMAVARSAANAEKISLFRYLSGGDGDLLPLPEIQIIGGGAHAGGSIDIQDFMIICTGAESYEQCLEMTFEVYRQCGILLKKRNKLAGVADEGGYWPVFDRNEDVFEVITESVEKAGYRPGTDIHFSVDIAASEFFTNDKYYLRLENQALEPDRFYDIIAAWCRKYPIISIEDPFAESDVANWKRLTGTFGEKLQVVGDDLFTTDVERVRQGREAELANSVLIKLNQIGTVTETIACIRETQEAGWNPIVSARSGETEDPFISHLAVATNAGQLKVGSFARSERMVKWNEIIRIKRQLADRSRFAGSRILPGR